MTPELLVTLAVATHANGFLRSGPCACGLRGAPGLALEALQGFLVEGEPTRALPEWLHSLKARGVRQLWLNVFQDAPAAPAGWALEVESAEGAEVWLCRMKNGRALFERVFSRVPVSAREPVMEGAAHRLQVAIAEAHRYSVEVRDLNTAVTLAEAVSFLTGTAPVDPAHLLPDCGYDLSARTVVAASQSASRAVAALGEKGPPLDQAILGALLAAAHSPVP